MTTSQSPLRVLKQQADTIARMMKQVSTGDLTGINDPEGKVAASLTRGTFKTGIAMDDKIITIEMAWEQIRETSEAGLSEFVLKQMKGSRDVAH